MSAALLRATVWVLCSPPKLGPNLVGCEAIPFRVTGSFTRMAILGGFTTPGWVRYPDQFLGPL